MSVETTVDDFDQEQLTEFFGEKELRWYQIAARNEIIFHVKRKHNARVLMVLPTGAGKTITCAGLLNHPELLQALNIPKTRKLKVLFIALKHRLLTQAERVFVEAAGVELILQSAFQPLPVNVDWDISVIDESHHESCTTIQYHLEQIGDKPILGMTATPDRADGCLIKFDNIVQPISREQAVHEGWLAETNIHSFVDGSEKSKTPILEEMFTNFAYQMGQTMVFVKTKQEVREVTTILQALGFDACGVLTQTQRELNEILDAFSEGRGPQFIVNCYKINEGVDVKGCTDVVLGRQFGSYAQLNQVIGRASRPDSACNVWELINPLSNRNLDTTVVVGTPASHRLLSKEKGVWVQREFDYVSNNINKQTFSFSIREA